MSNSRTSDRSSYCTIQDIDLRIIRFSFRSVIFILICPIFEFILTHNTKHDKYINIDFEEAYVPHKFEEIARQYLIRQNRLGNIEPVIEKIGKYYYDDPKTRTNGEFDVVTWDEKGYVFYEVKFRKKKTSKEVIEEEIRQVNATGLHCYKYVFFSRSGFTEKETDEIKQIELRELFN